MNVVYFQLDASKETFESDLRLIASDLSLPSERVSELVSIFAARPPSVTILFGGETTVTVRGTGKGGRNQEIVHAWLLHLANHQARYTSEQAFGAPLSELHEWHATLLSGGTDGQDGPTDIAGAVADFPDDVIRMKTNFEAGVAEDLLDNNDSYQFWTKFDADQRRNCLVTGVSGTNVMDIQILHFENLSRRG